MTSGERELNPAAMTHQFRERNGQSLGFKPVTPWSQVWYTTNFFQAWPKRLVCYLGNQGSSVVKVQQNVGSHWFLCSLVFNGPVSKKLNQTAQKMHSDLGSACFLMLIFNRTHKQLKYWTDHVRSLSHSFGNLRGKSLPNSRLGHTEGAIFSPIMINMIQKSKSVVWKEKKKRLLQAFSFFHNVLKGFFFYRVVRGWACVIKMLKLLVKRTSTLHVHAGTAALCMHIDYVTLLYQVNYCSCTLK